MTTLSELENVIFNDTKKLTVLMVTEKEHFYNMKDLVKKVVYCIGKDYSGSGKCDLHQ